jgi:hypothetical protein
MQTTGVTQPTKLARRQSPVDDLDDLRAGNPLPTEVVASQALGALDGLSTAIASLRAWSDNAAQTHPEMTPSQRRLLHALSDFYQEGTATQVVFIRRGGSEETSRVLTSGAETVPAQELVALARVVPRDVSLRVETTQCVLRVSQFGVTTVVVELCGSRPTRQSSGPQIRTL